MPKKSKPKRTNWKQRALHCEEVIKIQNVLAESREKKHAALLLRAEELRKKLCETMDYGMELDKQVELEVKLRDEYWNRALAAEKHNALLLEEREKVKANMFTITSHSDGIKLGFHQENGEMVLDEHNFASDDEARAAANQIFPAWTQEAIGIRPKLTRWQRFKSWLSRWEKPAVIIVSASLIGASILGIVAHWLARKQEG